MVAMGASWEGQMPWFRMAQSRRPKAATAAVTRAWPSSGVKRGLLDGAAEVGASALVDEGFGLLGGGAVAEDDLCAGLTEEADGGCADSAGASGDEGDFARERHDDT